MSQRLVLNEDKKIALVYRLQTPKAITLAKDLTSWLKGKGYKVYTAPEQKLIPGTEKMASHRGLKDMSMIIVLGGDGTYLRAVRILDGIQVPIFGVNVGSLGFLTGTRFEDLYTSVEQALKNKMHVVPRSMLEVSVFRKKKKKAQFLSLNDVVIERGSLSQLIHLSIYSESFLVSEVKCDGLIIATPTGSTAYNLAAGGPILHPDVGAFIVTPISPHSLTSRPFIFPDKQKLSFRLMAENQKAHFIVDGQKYLDLGFEDEVVISRSAHDHLMVRAPDHDYFHLLREKFKFGDRN